MLNTTSKIFCVLLPMAIKLKTNNWSARNDSPIEIFSIVLFIPRKLPDFVNKPIRKDVNSIHVKFAFCANVNST